MSMIHDEDLKTLEHVASEDDVLATYMDQAVAELKQPQEGGGTQRFDPLVGIWAALGVCLVIVVKAGVERWRGENELALAERRLSIIAGLQDEGLTKEEATRLVEQVIGDIRRQRDDSDLIKSLMSLQLKLNSQG
jgi:hypothetical protein